MCFSAQASFIASVLLSGLGFISYKAAQSREHKLLALTPLLFGIQQGLEGLVWLMLPTVSLLARLPMYAYLLFAYCFWPVWVPWVMSLIEKNLVRRIAVYATLAVGALVSLFFVKSLLLYGAQAQIAHHHIAYSLNEPLSFFMAAFLSVLYLIATVLPFFLATDPLFWLIGGLLALSYLVSFLFYYHAIGSVWCFFGAVISSLIVLIVYKK